MKLQGSIEVVQVSGEYLISAPRTAVWAQLQDPSVLEYCIHGCERVVRSPEGEYHATFRIGVGPAKGRLDARLRVVEIAPPDEYQLQVETHLRFLGDAKGSAQVRLTSHNTETILAYVAEIYVEGWFAQLGNSLLSAAADRAMAHFFERFAEVVV